MDKSNCGKFICEWERCMQGFGDRLKFLSHITHTHVRSFRAKQKCFWNGCENWEFDKFEHFQLHLSIHAYHQQIMNMGYNVMISNKPRMSCYMDPSSRNVIADVSSVLLCGWKNCNGEFFDYELFILHVDTHAMEDVQIPVMSKEALKKLKFAKCDWVNCNAAFNSKSHLKAHLMSHTQKKTIACPVCGMSFCTKNGFLNHCYRQETPTSIENFQITNFEDDEETEGILTIDEDVNPSSIVIHLPDNLQKIIPSQAIIANNISQANGDIEMTTNSPHLSITSAESDNPQGKKQNNQTSPQFVHLPNQKVALLVNVNLTNASTSNGSNQNRSSSNGEATSGNLIQLSLASAGPSEEIDREFRCFLCTKSFSTRSLLREHTNKHIRKYLCPHCSYAAPYPARLKDHILFRHDDKREFDCKFCEQTFKNKYSLRRHIQLHNVNEEEQNACEYCSQKFTNYYSLHRHIRIVHIKEQIVFACHLCKKEYNRGNNLSRHLTSVHKLEPSSAQARFVYEKQHDGVFRLKGNLSLTQEPQASLDS